jgi:hypothetical protein
VFKYIFDVKVSEFADDSVEDESIPEAEELSEEFEPESAVLDEMAELTAESLSELEFILELALFAGLHP